MNRSSLFAIILLLILLTPAEAPSCGPSFPHALFVTTHVPGVPLEDYGNGRIGIVRGSLWLQYLIPAWRHLSGRPVKLDLTKTADITDPPQIETRAVPGDQYAQYPNCLPEAKATAERTLKEREAKFGANHAGVKAWKAAQELVFKNCSEGIHIPPEPEPDLPALLIADRRYQIASAHFYAGNWDAARNAFVKIAADRTSPWQPYGSYLAARSMLRKATLPEAPDAALLAQAEKEFLQASKENRDPKMRLSAKNLADYVAGRLRPEQRMAELANLLNDPKQDANFERNLHDFDFLWTYRGTPKNAHGSELLEWLLTMRGILPLGTARDATQPAWLVAALERSAPEDPTVPKLLDQARTVAPSLAAYPTVAFHIVRLSAASAPQDAKRKELDTIITNLRSYPRSALNPFYAARLPLSRDMGELLRYSQRTPAGLGYEYANLPHESYPANQASELFGDDSAEAFNRHLPISRWMEAATSTSLPPSMRNRVIRTAWTRALVTGDLKTATALSPELARIAPEIASSLTVFQSETNPTRKNFAGAYIVAATPALKPFLLANVDRDFGAEKPMPLTELEGFRRDWWCVPEPAAPGASSAPPAFLSPEETARADRDVKTVAAEGAGANFVAKHAAAFAQAYRDDPRAPEALHLAVRASRLGCRDDNTGRYSKLAHETLHKLYPRSEWAKKTPYWFKKD